MPAGSSSFPWLLAAGLLLTVGGCTSGDDTGPSVAPASTTAVPIVPATLTSTTSTTNVPLTTSSTSTTSVVSATSSTPTTSSLPSSPVGPVWPIETRSLQASGPAAGPPGGPVLQAIRTERLDTYERLVLDFDGPFGDVRVSYVPVVRADPSDQVVPLAGRSYLSAVVHGAVARSGGPGIAPYTGPETVTPDYPTLKQVSISGDFEGVVSISLGLDRTAGFQVTRESSPDRLVIDVASRPDWQMWPEDSLADAATLQAAVDQGAMPWRLEPLDVVAAYARDVYGIEDPEITEISTDTYRVVARNSTDELTVRITRPFAATTAFSIVEIADTR